MMETMEIHSSFRLVVLDLCSELLVLGQIVIQQNLGYLRRLAGPDPSDGRVRLALPQVVRLAFTACGDCFFQKA